MNLIEPVIEAEAFTVTLGTILNVFKFCEVDWLAEPLPVLGLNSSVKWFKAKRTGSLRVILASKSPLEDAVTLMRATGSA